MYPELMVIPMREELTKAGVAEARTAADVDAALAVPAILRDGQLVYLMQRSAIESSTAPAIAQELARAFDTYCAKSVA